MKNRLYVGLKPGETVTGPDRNTMKNVTDQIIWIYINESDTIITSNRPSFLISIRKYILLVYKVLCGDKK